MQQQCKFRNGLSLLAGLCVIAISAGLPAAAAQGTGGVSVGASQQPSPSKQQPSSSKKASVKANQPAAKRSTAPQPAQLAKPFFVEFRARSALSYGHTYLAHGRLNAKGDIEESEVAGFHPFTESPIPWMIGHLLPVPAETGASDGDTEEQYITARFRVPLTEEEYARVVAHIRHEQATSPLWHAVLYNCNAWVGNIARAMGLQAPFIWLQYPENYIAELGELNGGQVQIGQVQVSQPEQEVAPPPKPAVKQTAARRPATRQATARRPAAPQPAAPQHVGELRAVANLPVQAEQ